MFYWTRGEWLARVGGFVAGGIAVHRWGVWGFLYTLALIVLVVGMFEMESGG